MFENLQSQLASLRLLVSSADPKTGKPQSIGSPTRGRSKSVAVVQDVAAAEPSPHLRQAVRLFDLWQERMEGDHAQLREGIRAVSHTVDTVCDPSHCHWPELATVTTYAMYYKHLSYS